MLLIYSLGPPSTDCPNSPCCKSSCGRPQRTAKRPFFKHCQNSARDDAAQLIAALGCVGLLARPAVLPSSRSATADGGNNFLRRFAGRTHDRIHNRKGRIPSADLSRASGSPGAHGRKHLRGPRSTAAWQASARSAGAARGPRPRRRDIEMSRSEVHPPNTQRAAGPSSAAVLLTRASAAAARAPGPRRLRPTTRAAGQDFQRGSTRMPRLAGMKRAPTQPPHPSIARSHGPTHGRGRTGNGQPAAGGGHVTLPNGKSRDSHDSAERRNAVRRVT